MATLVVNAGKVVINGINLSSAFINASIDFTAEMQDDTAFGDAFRSRKAGLKDYNISLEGNQDYATSVLDDTVFSLVGGSAFVVNIQADTAATSTTNPLYSANCLIQSYQPARLAVGEFNKTTLVLAGAGSLTRSTS